MTDTTQPEAATTHPQEPAADRPGTAYYQRIGGAPTVRTVVDDLYFHALRDEQLSPYFAGTDLSSLKRHMVLMLTKVLGGPDTYTGRGLAEAHQGLDITGEHYERVGHVLLDVLRQNGAGADVITHVSGVLATVREQVVRQPGDEPAREA
ncbi:group 1 truncated hemoglobin [Streptomyces sp. NPDC004065]|uniref:group I truncated hemoglobin n=1 Tax=Streptomyces sp. NPDC004065 TaxID=3364689 RepID=UPI00384C2F27